MGGLYPLTVALATFSSQRGAKSKHNFLLAVVLYESSGERTLPSKQVGSGVERNLIGRTDGLMPSGIPRGPSATLPEECSFID